MNRLLVLIVEVEQPEGLSSRKLIIESMKHNVVTAYSGQEALDLLARIRPDIILLHINIQQPSCSDLLHTLKTQHADMPAVVMSPTGARCSIEDFQVNSLEPAELVRFFQNFSQNILGVQPMQHPSTRTVVAEPKPAR